MDHAKCFCLLACVAATTTPADAGEPVPLTNRSPQLIAVWPAEGAAEVACDAELRLRFDKPVNPDDFEVTWKRGGFLSAGPLEYLADKNEIVLPVRLRPGTVHEVEIGGGSGRHALASGGVPLTPASWRFETTASVTEEGGPAQAVSVDPPSGSIVPRLAFITVRFDKAIDPTTVSATAQRTSGAEAFAERVEAVPAASYDAETHAVTLPVVLPANWSGEVTLTATGASPVTVAYTTAETLIDREHPAVAAPAGSAAELKRVVGRALAARGDLRSAEVVSQNRSYSSAPGGGVGFQRLGSKTARFAFQGDRQFVGDVSGWMGQPFMVGSDGTTCWFLSERPSADRGPTPTLIRCDFDSIDKKRVAIADAFGFGEGPIDGTTIDKLIADRGLTLVANDRGPADPYVIRSWLARKSAGDNLLVEVTDWSIDAETFLPTRVISSFGGHQMTTELTYRDINSEIPLRRFQPPIESAVQKEAPAPLGERYDRRFLQLGDGSSGRVSCRWGVTGSGGTSGSGLN